MNDARNEIARPGRRPPGAPGRYGLCDTCVNAKLIRNTRGSSFVMCLMHKTDDRFPKYPPVPIVECRGFAEPSES
ncbi:MAG: hypothetical protein WAP35_04530 [Solirubrobacterales bacterium]